MDQTRRRHLRSIGGAASLAVTGLAGCVGDAPVNSGGGAGGPDTPTESACESETGTGAGGGDTRPAGTGGPGVTLVAVDDAVDIPVTPSVEVVREAATPESPPQLRTTLTNTSDERVSVGEARAMHFEYVTDDSGALIFLPSGGEYPAEPDCWRLTDDIATVEDYRTLTLAPGCPSSRLVSLYARPGGDACLPVGEHRFETTISILSVDAEPQSSAQWGFTVLLE